MTPWWRHAIGVGALALAVRLVVLAAGVGLGAFPEFWEPEVLARNVLAGRGYIYPEMNTLYHAYMEPLYPGLVVAVYALTGGSVMTLGVIQCVLSALLPILVFAWTRRTFDTPSAVAAGIVAAVHPGLAGYAIKFHPFVLDSLLPLLFAVALLRLSQQDLRRCGIAVGLTLGLSVLTRPTVLAFAAPAAAMVAFAGDRRVRRSLFVAFAIAVAVVLPWVIRNYLVLDAFVLTRSNVGYVFWLGNHPGASGRAAHPNDPSGMRSVFEDAPAELRARILASDELGQQRIFFEEALTHIRAAPGAFFGRWSAKLWQFWGMPRDVGGRYSGWQLRAYLAFYTALVAATIAGLWRAWRDPQPGQATGLAFSLMLPLSVAVTQSLFYVEGRHRLAVEAALAIPAGHALARLRVTYRWPAMRGMA